MTFTPATDPQREERSTSGKARKPSVGNWKRWCLLILLAVPAFYFAASELKRRHDQKEDDYLMDIYHEIANGMSRDEVVNLIQRQPDYEVLEDYVAFPLTHRSTATRRRTIDSQGRRSYVCVWQGGTQNLTVLLLADNKRVYGKYFWHSPRTPSLTEIVVREFRRLF